MVTMSLDGLVLDVVLDSDMASGTYCRDPTPAAATLALPPPQAHVWTS
jgi:hypothetical protein